MEDENTLRVVDAYDSLYKEIGLYTNGLTYSDVDFPINHSYNYFHAGLYNQALVTDNRISEFVSSVEYVNGEIHVFLKLELNSLGSESLDKIKNHVRHLIETRHSKLHRVNYKLM